MLYDGFTLWNNYIINYLMGSHPHFSYSLFIHTFLSPHFMPMLWIILLLFFFHCFFLWLTIWNIYGGFLPKMPKSCPWFYKLSIILSPKILYVLLGKISAFSVIFIIIFLFNFPLFFHLITIFIILFIIFIIYQQKKEIIILYCIYYI